MVVYLPRSAWGARAPSSGPGQLVASRVLGTVIHWPGTGTTRPIHTRAAVASALRGWQAYHMDSRGWSDIAYQVAVDQAGRAWTLRGLRTQSGANGNTDLNRKYGAILLVLVTGEQPTSAMKATVRGVVADFRRFYPRGLAIRPHSAVRPDGTDCPGPAARAALARGDFTPNSSPEDEMTPAQMQELKNFIEARTQAYAVWLKRQMAPEVERIVQRYTLGMQEWERQTDAADAARAAAAVWATEPPRPGQEPTEPTDPVDPADPTEPTEPPDPNEPTENGPTDPNGPTEPTGPGGPTDPVDLDDLPPFPPLPEDPTDQTDPAPSEPSEQAEPAEPTEPSEPSEQSEPSETGDHAIPGEPGEAGDNAIPSEPAEAKPGN
ncbi:hypothetical protein GCM10009789_40840 [Kribbella sancticallisti]|uniref:Peptidoglycan recognition protein family domain-containing protein n=1 Tax=Kribbella sancticallisti TaxID=460087 RepID=A0ABP4PJ87_9ACTN